MDTTTEQRMRHGSRRLAWVQMRGKLLSSGARFVIDIADDGAAILHDRSDVYPSRIYSTVARAKAEAASLMRREN